MKIKDLILDLEKRGLEPIKISENQIKINIDKDNLLNHLSYIQEKGFVHLAFISGVDYIEEDEFEVVYHTYSYEDKINILNKVRIDRKKPNIASVVSIWEQAQFYEQEIHEFFGIYFEGNKDLSPLFLENFLDIPPLRKDFNTREYSIKAFGANIQGGGK
ncbi:MAG: NADH-quinone oxidoreductase subunit C [Clostridiaceae bacterium]